MTTPTPEQLRALADRLDRDVLAADVRHASLGVDVDKSVPHIRVMRDASAALRAAADQLEAVREALSRHPKCDKYDEDDVVSCGWKSAVRDITWAVNHD